MELIQVFDWLKMKYPLSEKFQDFVETDNDSYVRWYPREDKEYPDEIKDSVNEWLREQGMIQDKNDKYFHVLIHVSW